MHCHLIGVHVEGHIGGMEEVVGEVLLDDVALVSAADDEVIDAVLGINLQNVPQNGPAANLDHRLGTNYRFFRETRAEAASEDYSFHGLDGLLRWLLHCGRQRPWLPTSRLSITRGSVSKAVFLSVVSSYQKRVHRELHESQRSAGRASIKGSEPSDLPRTWTAYPADSSNL